jgi:hypothetical protein
MATSTVPNCNLLICFLLFLRRIYNLCIFVWLFSFPEIQEYLNGSIVGKHGTTNLFFTLTICQDHSFI